MIKRSWTEINLNQILINYRIYKEQLPEGQKVMAVVKADAYGHGDVQVAELLQREEGCEDFAVSNICEAIKLRKAGIKGQILILGYTPTSCALDLMKYDITQALISEEYALALEAEMHKYNAGSDIELGTEDLEFHRIKAQFAIDTGMNRIGLDADDTAGCEQIIRRFASSPDLELNGLFTHLCVADTPDETEFTDGQIDKFIAVADSVADLRLPYIHCNNTAGGFWHNKFGVFSRLGISLYGMKPDYANDLPEGIKPALSWKSVISMVKDVRPGETIGYGRSFKAERPMRVATIPTGYADGYSRFLSNVGSVVIAGKKARIVGRVCMDQFMVDVTDIPYADMGCEVELIGETYGADDMAHDIGTIGYEITCDITARVDRNYI